MNNQQVAHEWWKGEKRTGKGSHFYFEGETIYSYGIHFPVAQKVQTPGGLFVLFTTGKYSISTTRHISYTRSAIDSYACAGIVNVDLTEGRLYFYSATEKHGPHLRNMLRQRITQAESLIIEAGRPRIRANTRDARLSAFQREAANIRLLIRMAAALGETLDEPAQLAEWERQASDGRAGLTEALEKIRAATEARERARAEAWRKQMEEEDRHREERLAEWRQGADRYIGRLSWGYALRIRGAHVETSGGVQIPLSLAKRLLPLALRALAGEADAAAFKAAGVSDIGGFPVHVIDAKSWRIGCHDIPAAEVARIVEELQNEKAA